MLVESPHSTSITATRSWLTKALGIVGAALLIGAASAQSITNVRVSNDNSDTGVVNGTVRMDIGKKYNGALVINDTAGVYPWTISGGGFGSKIGTVSLNGRSLPVTSWSDSRITVNLSTRDLNSKAPLEFKSDFSHQLKVATKSGKNATRTVWWVPAVEGRIFGQCTWYVAWKRKAAGLGILSYRGYATMAPTWRPAELQGLKWGVSYHNALIERVEALKDNRGKLTGAYRLTIGEFNAGRANAYSQYEVTVNPAKGQYPGASYKNGDKASGYCP